MTARRLRTFVVDDERLARRELRGLLDATGAEVVGEAETVAGAVEGIETAKPDLLLLDIQLRGESGFDLLERLPERPPVVFVTAFDEYAVRAFEVNALDYLLKPVRADRLREAIERVRAGTEGRAGADAPLASTDRVWIETARRARLVPLAGIACIRAAGDYSEVVTDDGDVALVLCSLKRWERRLPPGMFLRVHRGAIVNLEHVEDVKRRSNQTFLVNLRSGATIEGSRRYLAKLRERFG